MDEQERDPKPNPDPGHPSEDGTLPEESPSEGEAAREKGDVEWEEPKPGRPGEGHPAREHDEPQV